MQASRRQNNLESPDAQPIRGIRAPERRAISQSDAARLWPGRAYAEQLVWLERYKGLTGLKVGRAVWYSYSQLEEIFGEPLEDLNTPIKATCSHPTSPVIAVLVVRPVDKDVLGIRRLAA